MSAKHVDFVLHLNNFFCLFLIWREGTSTIASAYSSENNRIHVLLLLHVTSH